MSGPIAAKLHGVADQVYDLGLTGSLSPIALARLCTAIRAAARDVARLEALTVPAAARIPPAARPIGAGLYLIDGDRP